jgi:Flp pilus assembly pilin Flp
MVEYALILFLVSVAALAAMHGLGDAIVGMYSVASSAVDAAIP